MPCIYRHILISVEVRVCKTMTQTYWLYYFCILLQYNEEIQYVEPCLNGTLVQADVTNKDVSYSPSASYLFATKMNKRHTPVLPQGSIISGVTGEAVPDDGRATVCVSPCMWQWKGCIFIKIAPLIFEACADAQFPRFSSIHLDFFSPDRAFRLYLPCVMSWSYF